MTMNLGQLPTYESLLPVLRTQTTSYLSPDDYTINVLSWKDDSLGRE